MGDSTEGTIPVIEMMIDTHCLLLQLAKFTQLMYQGSHLGEQHLIYKIRM